MHPKQFELEQTFKKLFDEVDDWLEDKYDGNWRLHPNRLKRGLASNKEADGLFNIGMTFSLGYGTQFGRGYVIDLSVSTLERLPFGMKKQLYGNAVKKIEELLPKYFSDRKLFIKKDGAVYKILGDFSLGEV